MVAGSKHSGTPSAAGDEATVEQGNQQQKACTCRNDAGILGCQENSNYIRPQASATALWSQATDIMTGRGSSYK